MSEEILKALAQLFEIITKQDGGVSEGVRRYVINFFQTELDRDSIIEYLDIYERFSDYGRPDEEDDGKKRLTAVKDTVKTLGICKKINKALTQEQKVVVLINLLELGSTDKNFTSQRMEIINTVSTVFNIVKDEYELIERFVITDEAKSLNYPDILVLDS